MERMLNSLARSMYNILFGVCYFLVFAKHLDDKSNKHLFCKWLILAEVQKIALKTSCFLITSRMIKGSSTEFDSSTSEYRWSSLEQTLLYIHCHSALLRSLKSYTLFKAVTSLRSKVTKSGFQLWSLEVISFLKHFELSSISQNSGENCFV